ncbi:hypothetical protein K435DRAFT_613941, partial [Dendrothele bispora CBS 962.96]
SQAQSDKLPKRYKVPPIFDAAQPGTLTKYLDELEEIFEVAGVEKEDAKIILALKYMEWATRKIHEGLATECQGDYAKFKEEMKKAYPESVDNGRGSVKRLKDIVNRHRIIPLNQRERFLRYVREFQLELTKLQKPPYAISNGEAVKLFLKGLDKEFLRAITLLLPAAAEDRRVEDPYDIEDIISA